MKLAVPAGLAADPAGAFAGKPAEWFRSAEGQRVTTNILSWQAATGSWPKNGNTTSKPNTKPATQLKGTFDNSATTGELRYLAAAFNATQDPRCEAAALKGIDHILQAQYPTGGWPQYYPPSKQYHRHITFNDNSMVRLLIFLRDVATAPGFAFVGAPRRQAAQAAFDRGIQCILKCQVVVNGKLTVWCAQHDELDLRPRSARTYELASLSGSESVGILELLMSLDRPSPEVVRAINAGAAWFESAKLTGIKLVKGADGRVVERDASAPPLWARFYDLETGQPIFSGRDGVKTANYNDIERERRNGYAWYGNWGGRVAAKYAQWKQRQAGQSSVTQPSPLRLVIIGDSTVCDYPATNACRGWGQFIQGYFSDTVSVINLARSGRSTKTFIKEGLWAKALAEQPAFVLIQFGHNDSHDPAKPEATDAATDYRDFLRRYIAESRAAGAKPVLVTPMYRRTFDDASKLTDILQPYADAMKAVAAETSTPLIDLHAASGKLFTELGQERSKAFANAADDRTHFNEAGARAMAKLVMAELPQQVPELKPRLADAAAPAGRVAAKPLFRDPVYDGAADPVVIWNHAAKQWWMLYTNRRANAPGLRGVAWVHGTRIGIAESADGGATWTYRGTANIPLGQPEVDSHWAPDVVFHDGTYHMFLSFVPGMHEDWGGTRSIHHLTSTNLLDWHDEGALALASDRVIDATVFRLPDGSWRLWYNNEPDRKAIYSADSPDLFHWTDKGKVIGDKSAEGPKVFRWQGKFWMIVDQWEGLGVYRSDDASRWERQPRNILAAPGTGADDQVKGGHADVVVSGDRAYLFYFTHTGRRGTDAGKDTAEQRRSSIQVVELRFEDGWLNCDRDQPTNILLQPPTEPQ